MNKIYLIKKIFLPFLLLSYGISGSNIDNLKESKTSTTNQSIIEENKSKSISTTSADNRDAILHTMGNCEASCCSNNSVSLKNKKSISEKKKTKKRFGWFHRDK